MQDELKPCPFCGGAAALRSVKLPMLADCDDICIYCTDCDVDGPHILFDQTEQAADDIPGMEAEAITAWNTRVDAHPPTTNPVAVSETPVGDHQMVEAVARAIYEEDDPWHKAWPWPDLQPSQANPDAYRRLAQAALTAARAQVEGEIAEWHGFKAKCLRDLADMNLPAVSPTIARAEARWHDEVRADLAAGEHRKDG